MVRVVSLSNKLLQDLGCELADGIPFIESDSFSETDLYSSDFQSTDFISETVFGNLLPKSKFSS